jgi:lipid-A-disaccharide synthase
MSAVALERLMIVAGESSGELYGAYLARALTEAAPGVRIIGIGGDRMKAAGVELIAPIASSFGILEVLQALRRLRSAYRTAVASLDRFRPQVLVLIDYPDFNLRLARAARRRGIKVLYYVSPQVWAWRSGRVKKISALVDHMAVILPFEADIYGHTGMKVDFVGHPVVDEINEVLGAAGYSLDAAGTPALKDAMRRRLGLDPSRNLIVIMPGSRRHEVERLLPVFQETMTTLQQCLPGVQFIIPIAPNIDRRLFGAGPLPAGFRLVEGRSIECLAAADAGIIASGTSTLQAALLGVPMVVAYKVEPLTFCIGKMVVKVKFISLPNLLLEWSARNESGLRITELIQKDVDSATLADEVTRLMRDESYRVEMLSQLGRVQALFSGRRPSDQVARIAVSLAQEATEQR